ncbi:MAG TPA: amidohydrolase family protein [Methanoregulaceae archaeon]|nr:amidohydrolase family protein [Methanoregulaceae archaeon]
MSVGNMIVEGRALVGTELEPRDVLIEVREGKIRRIEDSRAEEGIWICPAFFNAHTHLADAIAMDIPKMGGLEDLVSPPSGMKHRILAATPKERLVKAMRATISTMIGSGQQGFADFREGGVEGVEALRQAALGIPCLPVIFGREGGESIADGIGISSVRDVSNIDSLIRPVRERGGMVAFHAGERDSMDIDEAIEYQPDLLIHCTHATPAQISRIADLEIPVAVCARSNWMLGTASSSGHPPIKEMQKKGCRIVLGTDNVMFVQPDMWREMSFLSAIYRIEAGDLLQSAIAGADISNGSFFLQEGNSANFLILDTRGSNLYLSRDIHSTLVNRAGEVNIVNKVFNS